MFFTDEIEIMEQIEINNNGYEQFYSVLKFLNKLVIVGIGTFEETKMGITNSIRKPVIYNMENNGDTDSRIALINKDISNKKKYTYKPRDVIKFQNNFMLCGYYWDNNEKRDKAFVECYNENMKKIWSIYYKPKRDYFYNFEALVAFSDTEFYSVGCYRHSKNRKQLYPLIVKFDNKGKSLSKINDFNIKKYNSIVLKDVIKNKEKISFAGFTENTKNKFKSYVGSISNKGKNIFDKEIDFNELGDEITVLNNSIINYNEKFKTNSIIEHRINCMLLNKNDNIVITGSITFDNKKHKDVFLLEIDSDSFKILNFLIFGNENNEKIYALLELDEGGYILSGYSHSLKKNKSFGYLVAVDKNLNFIENKIILGDENTCIRSITKFTDEIYTGVGWTNSPSNAKKKNVSDNLLINFKIHQTKSK